MSRSVMVGAGLLCLASLSVPPLLAQADTLHPRAHDVLARVPAQDSQRTSQARAPGGARITLNVHDVTLKEALRMIAKRSAVALFYNDRDLPTAHRVSVTITNATVPEAVRRVLRGTPLRARPTAAGIVIEKRPAPPPRDPPVQQGSVYGRVTDAKTGTLLGGVSVTIGGTPLGAITSDSGTYRITGVPAGAYTVTAKRLGYQSASAPVTMVADQRAEVDFALTAATTVLDQVVVTGTVVPTEVKALPSPISVITAAEIQKQPASQLTQLFRQAVPGAVAPGVGAFFKQTPMSVRGAASLLAAAGTIKVYIDGVEVADKTLAGVDPNSIERIEVVRGPEAAAIYGSDAIGGVMQIFTKHGTLNQGPQLDAQLMLGAIQSPYEDRSALRQEYTASVHGGGAAMSYSLGGSYRREGEWVPGYSLSSPAAHGGIHIASAPFAVDLSVRYLSPNSGRPVDPRAIRIGYVPFSKPYYSQVSDPTATYGAHVVYTPLSWWQNSLTIGIDGDDADEYSTQPRLTTPADTLLFVSHQAMHKTSIAYNTSATFQLGAATSGVVTIGADHYNLVTDGASTSGATAITGTILTDPALPLTGLRTVTTNSGYFAQGQFRIHDALFLTAAVRAERNSNFGAALGTPFSPRAGVSYVRQLGASTLKLRASYGKALAPPGPLLKSAVNNGFQNRLANPVLGPERQEGGDAGVDLVFGSRGSLGITAYDQTADGIIQQVLVDASTNPPTYQYQNVGRVKNRGVEVDGALHWRTIQLTGQYAYTNSHVQTIGEGYTGPLHVGDQSLSIPRNTGGISITLRPFRGATLAAWLTYTGTSRQTDFLAEFACFAKSGPCRASARDYLTTYPSSLETNFSITYALGHELTAFVSMEDATNQIHNQLSNVVSNTGRITLAGLRLQRGLR